MPYVNIKTSKQGVTPVQKAKLIQGATQLSVDVSGKNPKRRTSGPSPSMRAMKTMCLSVPTHKPAIKKTATSGLRN